MNRIPLTILIPTKNEENNITKCLEPIHKWANEIVVLDSQSTDKTLEIVDSYGCSVQQFFYKGGWPKKRQWALDNLKFKNQWILLLDSDEILTEQVKFEIEKKIEENKYFGFYIDFKIYFLGKLLSYGDTVLTKLSLFKQGCAAYELRLSDQDQSMLDIEIHEHVCMTNISKAEKLTNAIKHENVNALSRYIEKHNHYSNWESKIYADESEHIDTENESLSRQAKFRRKVKSRLIKSPFSSIFSFVYFYILKGGFIDGYQGFLYAGFRSFYLFQVNAKIFERKINKK